MNALSVILPIILLISLILDYLWSLKKGNSFDIVRKMGIGYNLANTFDSFSFFTDLITPDEQIELNGNIAPNKDMIKRLKKYGFKTIRFPVTWMNFIDDEGNVKSEWMKKVKQVIDEKAKELGTEIKLVNFVRFKLGEGLQKKEEDFAAEVAAQLAK